MRDACWLINRKCVYVLGSKIPRPFGLSYYVRQKVVYSQIYFSAFLQPPKGGCRKQNIFGVINKSRYNFAVGRSATVAVRQKVFKNFDTMKTQNENTNKTATKAVETRTYETLTHEALKAMALEIASQVHTCKEASARYAELADRFGKDVAKEILAVAKTHVKARVQAVTSDAKSVRARLGDGAKVAKDAWNGLLRDEDTQGRMWARAVYESAGCDLEAMAVKFADYVAETADGRTIVAKRTTRKGVSGERESGYAPMSGSVGSWLSALKTAVKNAKKAALGASRSEYQRTVELTWDE